MEFLLKDLASDDLDLGTIATNTLIQKGSSCLPTLVPYLQDSNWIVRFRVASIIEKIGIRTDKIYEAVQHALLEEKDEAVRKKLLQALIESEIEQIVPAFDPQNILSGRENEVQWKSIEWFPQEEAIEIQDMLREREYTFRIRKKILSHPELPNYQERYIFEVPSELFSSVLEVFKEYFGLEDDTECMGECPACGCEFNSGTRCPDCGLNLENNPLYELCKHPFFIFLAENELIEDFIK